MENVPYEFVDKVLTLSDQSTIVNMALDSSLWTYAASTYKRRLQNIGIFLYKSTDGLVSYIICKYSNENNGERIDIDDLFKMDPRYVRLNRIEVFSYPFFEAKNLEKARLLDLIAYVSHFTVKNLAFVDLSGQWNDLLKLLLAKLTQYDLKVQNLNINYFPMSYSGELLDFGGFVRNQMKNEELSGLILNGNWTLQLQDDLLGFICRPTFAELKGHYGGLRFEHIKLIIDYWKTMKDPWNRAIIWMESRHIDEELALFMDANGMDENQKSFVLKNGRSVVDAKCSLLSCSLEFTAL